jgi:hypothetical protein
LYAGWITYHRLQTQIQAGTREIHPTRKPVSGGLNSY